MQKLKSSVVRMRAVAESEEAEVKQAKEMAAARRRWETLVLFLLIYFLKLFHTAECGY